jgi:hypothetical protein
VSRGHWLKALGSAESPLPDAWLENGGAELAVEVLASVAE